MQDQEKNSKIEIHSTPADLDCTTFKELWEKEATEMSPEDFFKLPPTDYDGIKTSQTVNIEVCDGGFYNTTQEGWDELPQEEKTLISERLKDLVLHARSL